MAIAQKSRSMAALRNKRFCFAVSVNKSLDAKLATFQKAKLVSISEACYNLQIIRGPQLCDKEASGYTYKNIDR
jgi:hypothetical protein